MFTETDLQKILFENYSTNVLPHVNKSTPIEVEIDLYLISIDNVDEKKQSITIRATLEISWKDDFLVWNPMTYGNVSTINVKQDDIWYPNIALKHTFHRPTDLGQAGGRAIVDHDGSVLTWPYKLYTVACKIKIAKFPFDKQTCEFIFVPWTNPTDSMMLFSKQIKPDLTMLSESGEWAILDCRVEHATLSFSEDSFTYVHFVLDLQRKALYHVLNALIPVMCISLLNIACFILPSHGGERVTLSISIFLTLAVFLTVVNSSMPESSDEVSALSVYVGLQLFGSVFTVVFTIISLTLFHRDKSIDISMIWTILVRICCVKKKGKYNSESRENGGNTKHDSDDVTWILVSQALDKFCLIAACIWHATLTTSLMLSITI
ncbi:5-hydroxytryptamine receptor 3A [Mactra antiquata]